MYGRYRHALTSCQLGCLRIQLLVTPSDMTWLAHAQQLQQQGCVKLTAMHTAMRTAKCTVEHIAKCTATQLMYTLASRQLT